MIAAAPAPAPDRSRGIEALRGIAAVMVLSVHATSLLLPASSVDLPVWSTVHRQLNSGFQLFFVVSGFLIAGPFIRDLIHGCALPAVRPYALRRILRIGPAFWAVLLFFVLINPVGDWGAVVSHATFAHDLVPHQSGTILPVAWTLSIEALFYASVPLAALAIRRRGQTITAGRLAAWVLVAWALSVAWELSFSVGFGGPYGSAAVSPRDDMLKLFTISLPGMFCMFCPGLLVAVGRVSGTAFGRTRSRPGVALLFGGALWFVSGLAQSQIGGIAGACLGDQLRGVAFAAVLLGAINWERRPGLLLRAAGGLGVVSYGIYLWHWLVIHGIAIVSGQAHPFGGALGTPLAIAVSLLATLPFAVISWYVIERPCLRWGASIARRGRFDAPAAALELAGGARGGSEHTDEHMQVETTRRVALA